MKPPAPVTVTQRPLPVQRRLRWLLDGRAPGTDEGGSWHARIDQRGGAASSIRGIGLQGGRCSCQASWCLSHRPRFRGAGRICVALLPIGNPSIKTKDQIRHTSVLARSCQIGQWRRWVSAGANGRPSIARPSSGTRKLSRSGATIVRALVWRQRVRIWLRRPGSMLLNSNRTLSTPYWSTKIIQWLDVPQDRHPMQQGPDLSEIVIDHTHHVIDARCRAVLQQPDHELARFTGAHHDNLLLGNRTDQLPTGRS